MSIFHCFLLVSQIILSITTQGANINNFKFTNWFAFPGRQTNREFHLTVINKLLKFFEAFPWDMDVSAGLGLILLKINVESSLQYMKQMKQKFEGNRSPCVFDDDLQVVGALNNRTEKLVEKFIDYMLARVHRHDTYRKVASGFLMLEQNWERNIVTFPILVYTLTYSSRLANSWSVPTPTEYMKLVYNFTEIVPTMSDVGKCLVQLADTITFLYGIPQQCNVDDICSDVVYNGDDFGFGLGHRIFLLIYAKFARNCYYLSEGRDRKLMVKLCSIARLESDYLAIVLDYAIPDLLMEFMSYCTLEGHRESMREEWYVKMHDLYSSAKSADKICYVRSQFRKKHPDLENYKSTYWQLVRGTIKPMGPCDRRLTGLALAAHAAAFRACTQPVYCNAKLNRCCVPFETKYFYDYYLDHPNLTLQKKWFAWQYLTGYRKVDKWAQPDTDTNNVVSVVDPDASPWYWIFRSKLNTFRDEPNADFIKYDPDDDYFGID